jgi:hypothetical protein
MLKYLPGDLNLLHFKVQDKAIKYQDLLNQLIQEKLTHCIMPKTHMPK